MSTADPVAKPSLSLEELRGRVPEGELFAGKEWRWAPHPYRLDAKLSKELESMGHRLLQFADACDLLYRQSVEGRQPEWIARLLDRGKPPRVVALGREAAFRGQIARVIRPDLVLTEEGFTICELDQIPGGIGLTAWLNETYSSLGVRVLGGPDGMLAGFASVLPGGEILISEEAATYRPEMEWLAFRLSKRSREQGGSASWKVCNESNRDSWNGNVYRFFEMFDIPQIPCAEGLFRDALAGKVTVTPPPKAQLEEKLWMGLFWMAPLREFWMRQLGERGVQALQRWIPYTWILDPAPLPPNAVYPRLDIQDWKELGAFSQKERDLIIKISGFDGRAWGARGVALGADLARADWEAAIGNALHEFPEHPHIMQVFRHSVLTDQPFFDDDGSVRMMKGRARLSPYFFVSGGKANLGGVLATVCPADKKILHGMSDAVMVPVTVGDSRGGV
ncbi:MAG: hypothetical protein WAL87_01955 [Chthoniobacterales bacterium]